MKLSLTMFLLVLGLACHAQVADLIFLNGKIFTSDTSGLYVEAIAIKDGRILATGSNAAMEKFKSITTKQMDLAGKIVVPGFNDAHNHLPNALKSTFINLKGMNPSWQSLVDSIKVAVKYIPKGEFIQASIGLDISKSPEATRFTLDKLAPDHPILLLSWWGHVGIFNTMGMKKFGINIDQPDPKGGFYERLADGKTLTGKAYEKNAYWPNTSYDKIKAMRDDEKITAALRGLSRDLLRSGITSYQNMCTGANAEDFAMYWKKAGLPLRMRLIRWADLNPDGTLNIPSKQLSTKTSGLPLLSVSGTEALIREEAVVAYTLTSAFAEFQEQDKGTLTKGKFADLAILSQDIFTVPLNKLMQTTSLLTMVNGEIAYDAGVIK